MKKLLTTLALVLAFVLCLSVSVFAADSEISADNGTDTVVLYPHNLLYIQAFRQDKSSP